ncbi:MAG: hypothetical protein WD851_23340 [Pirellulales bacterium]
MGYYRLADNNAILLNEPRSVAAMSVALFFGWFAWQLFGPDPPIIVSRETTYLTAPLRADGLPDYEKYVLEKYREGVTPENNAAVLLLQAIGPGDMKPAEFSAVAKVIGLERVAPPDEHLNDVYSDDTRAVIAAWLAKERIPPGVNDEATAQDLETSPDAAHDEVVEDIIDNALERPWSSEQVPPLAEWVAANQEPLRLIVASSLRARFFAPMAELLNETTDQLIYAPLSGALKLRTAARALSTRAMWHLGEGRAEDSWKDISAIYRLSRLAGQGNALVEQLVSIAIEGIANRATLALLDGPAATPNLLLKIRHDLEALSAREPISSSIDQFERIASLSVVVCVRDGDAAELELSDGFEAVAMAACDWNISLRELNRWYDELVGVLRLPSGAGRNAALGDYEKRLAKNERSVSARRLMIGLLSRQVRSELLADIFVALMLPSTATACTAEDRSNTHLALTRLAVAVAIYRSEHGEYPEALESLAPDVLEKLPLDLYHNLPFIYRHTKNGYLLYSRGPNGNDDGGSNRQMDFYQGYSVAMKPVKSLRELLGDDLPESDDAVMRAFGEGNSLFNLIPTDADDIAIRLPLPKLELPKAK